MDLKLRSSYPIIRPTVTKRQGKNTFVSGGMSVFPSSDFLHHPNATYTLLRTNETFSLFEELQKCCLFGMNGILTAFSNVCLSVNAKLRVGRITQIDLAPLLGSIFHSKDLIIVAHSNISGVGGDVGNGEFLFSHFQYSDHTKVNVSASAFDNCPDNFQPVVRYDFYLAEKPDQQHDKLLYRSIYELSQNRPNFAIVYLYTSIETAVYHLCDAEDGRISHHLNNIYNQLAKTHPPLSKIVRSLKKKIESTIIGKRGEFAHQGYDLVIDDLLESYKVAVEFFWHYETILSETKILRDRI